MATIIAPDDFSPSEDAESIKTACVGLGTDEQALISILAHRNSAQRHQISTTFSLIYRQDIISQLKSEISGQFEKSMRYWVMPPNERDASIAHSALLTSPPNYKIIVELSCNKNPEELLAVKRAYHLLYKRSLEEDVALHTQGEMRKLLVALLSVYRYDGPEVDQKQAATDAVILNKSFNHEELIRVLSTKSREQLLATFEQFKKHNNQSITSGLKGNRDEYHSMLRNAIRCMKNPQKYFVRVLRSSNEEDISRVIVTRAEKDLAVIQDLFSKKTGEDLARAVERGTSGDNKTFLLALLGKF